MKIWWHIEILLFRRIHPMWSKITNRENQENRGTMYLTIVWIGSTALADNLSKIVIKTLVKIEGGSPAFPVGDFGPHFGGVEGTD